MKTHILASFVIFICCIGLFEMSLTAQNSTPTTANIQFEKSSFQIPKKATVNVAELETDFFPSLSLVAPFPDGDGYKNHLEQIKENIKPVANGKPSLQFKDVSTVTNDSLLPIVGMQLEGNAEHGNPNDNYLAISNDGWLVSVVNSSIFMVNANDTSATVEVALTTFAEALGNYNQDFDPKVLYDPNEDRFVLLFLNGYAAYNSTIIAGFSQTNDPTGEWNLYEIPGSPFDETTWSDYPMIVLTDNELLLTINLLNDNQGWVEGFTRTLIWQMDKHAAYDGEEELVSIMWDQNYYDEKPVRNAIPVKAGIGLDTTDTQYFLSNRNFAETNDTIFLIALTGDFGDDDAEVSVSIHISDLNYGVPPNATQESGYRKLNTNDGRILGAFKEDGRIHFVSNCHATETGKVGIYHGTFRNVDTDSITLSANMITDTLQDFGYPNLSFTGQIPEDDQFMLSFSHTSPQDFAGHSVLFYNFGEYSTITKTAVGERPIGTTNSQGVLRWGDYSGSQPKYDEPGVVWSSGSFSVYEPPSSYGKRGTWIVQLTSPIDDFELPIDTMEVDTMEVDTFVTGIQEQVFNELKAYPNPVRDYFSVQFDVSENTVITAILVDNQGREVKRLLKATAKAGTNEFRFSTHTLSAGTYHLVIQGEYKHEGKQLLSKQIIIQ